MIHPHCKKKIEICGDNKPLLSLSLWRDCPKYYSISNFIWHITLIWFSVFGTKMLEFELSISRNSLINVYKNIIPKIWLGSEGGAMVIWKAVVSTHYALIFKDQTQQVLKWRRMLCVGNWFKTRSYRRYLYC